MQFTTIPTRHDLGEGVLWHPTEQRLYWIDIYAGKLYRQDAAGKPELLLHLSTTIGCFGFRKDGGLVLATGKGFALCDADFSHVVYSINPEAERTNSRFNDGAVDTRGRFWAGTMSDGGPSNRSSALYCLHPDGRLRTVETGLQLVNGMAWSPDDKTMYLTDSMERVIWQYDFDADSGALSNKRVFMRTEAGEPDGLTVDAEGYIWGARWGSWHVYRFAPDGRMNRKVRLPVQHPTSPAFGGPNLQTLYISSASRPLDAAGKAAQPLAGDIFVLETAFKGMPAHFFGS